VSGGFQDAFGPKPTLVISTAKGGLEPRLSDSWIAAKVRFREMNILESVNKIETKPCLIGRLL
jgi:hypothetical protein